MFIHEIWGKFQKSELRKFILNFPLKHMITSTNQIISRYQAIIIKIKIKTNFWTQNHKKIMYNLHAEVSSGSFAFHLYCLRFHDRNLKFDFDASFLTLIWIQFWRFISNFLIEFDFEASFPNSYSNSTSKLCSQIIVRTRIQIVVSQVSFKFNLEFEAWFRNSCSNFNLKPSFRIVVLIVNWKWSFRFD